MNGVSMVLMGLGVSFLSIAAIGALRLPDFYTRSHAIGVMDTTGALLLLSGLALQYGLSPVTAKLIFLLLFLYLANPTMTHVLVRAAIKSGLKPWTGSSRG